jgi:TonB-linked SusC/RagA family outer membrane protein
MLLTALFEAGAFPFWNCASGFLKTKTFLVMKLTTVFLLAACMELSAAGYAQKVSISGENMNLKQVFKEIGKQSGYSFLYFDKDLQNAKKVSIDVRNEDLAQVLHLVFQEQPLAYSIVGNTIVVRQRNLPVKTEESNTLALPPPVELKGRVLDDKTGEPIVGANVQNTKTNRGTTTDKNGEFTITANPGDVLEITFVGYESKTVKVEAGMRTVTVRMPVTNQSMKEFVVTGIYSRPKQNFTGASSSFTAEELQKVSNNNLLTALKTLDPSFQIPENISLGSNPNSLPDVVLRSGNSLVDISQPSNTPFSYTNSVNTPLFILDGFEVSLQRINDLDMNRIIKVDVLKDAAATAIYGSRAANGVIVIETLRPKDGELRFTYNGSLSMETPDLSSYDLLNASEKLELERKTNTYTFYGWNDREQQLAYYYNARLAAVESGVNTDWLSQPVQTGIGQKHNIYLEGGGNNALYGINLTYNRITGAMKGSNRTNISGNTFLSYRVKDFLFRNDLTLYTNKANNSPYGSFTQYARLNPYWTPYDTSGALKVYLEDVRTITGSRLTNFDSYDNLDGQAPYRPTNPLYNASLNLVDQTSYNSIVNNFFVQWQAKQWFKATGRVAYQYQADESDRFLPAQHTSFVSRPTFEKGTYTKGYGKKSSLEGMLTADVNKAVGQHQFFGTVGVNANEIKYNTESFMVQGFPNPNLDQLVLGNRFPDGTKPTGTESISRMVGVLSNLSYSYDSRYLVDFSYRVDGSSQFGSNKRFAPFWALGAGWNLHNEPAFKNSFSFVNRLKLRYSFGYTGSLNFASYLGLTTSQYYTDRDYRGVISTYLLGFGNDALAWQRTRKSNFGADITLFNRLDIVANYFIEKTQGSIASISTAPSTGFNSYAENMGDIVGRGWELNTRFNIFSSPRERNNWSIFANLFSVTNKIERVSNTIAKLNETANTTKSSRPIIRYAPGQSTSAIWAVPSLGIDPSTGYEIFVKHDGTLTNVYDPLDQKIVGDSRPKLEGTFGTNFEKNGIGFNMFFRYRYGGQAYNQTLIERVENVNVGYYNVDRRVMEERWQKPGDHTFFKALIDQGGYALSEPTYASSRFVQDDNSISLESVSAYYRFSDKFNKRFKVQNTKITLYSGDVFWLSSIKRERGLDYPFARTFTLQLQTSF